MNKMSHRYGNEAKTKRFVTIKKKWNYKNISVYVSTQKTYEATRYFFIPFNFSTVSAFDDFGFEFSLKFICLKLLILEWNSTLVEA